jgi:hypothetical protein
MAPSNRTRAEELERRDWGLAILSIVIISILAFGLLLFRFPSVFGRDEGMTLATHPDYFFGFFAMVLLFNVFLIQRQTALRKLRRDLVQEQSRNIALHLQASQELLSSLPRLEAFEDSLAMEFRRSSAAGASLSVRKIHIKPSAHLVERNVQGAAYADSAKAILARLRKQGSMFSCDDGVFAAVLPGMSREDAQAFKDQIEETLAAVSGVTDRFQHESLSVSYPQDAESMHELKTLVVAK